MSLLCGCSKNTAESRAPSYSPASVPVQDDRTSTADGLLTKMVEFHPDLSHYELCTIIGRGHLGTTTSWVAKHIPSGTTVSIKREVVSWDTDLSLVQHGILMHRMAQHENILPFLACFVIHSEVWTVTPLMGFGSCKDLLHAHFSDGLPELAVAFILRDVLQGLNYLHQRGIVHRALQASHILISATGQVCLTGFRYAYSVTSQGKWSRSVYDFPDNYVNCLLWASPELLQQNLSGYCSKSDIYSLGITACELANGETPFSDMPLTQMLLEKIEGTTPRLLDSITVPDIINEELPPGVPGDSGIGESVGPSDNRGIFRRTFSQHFHHLVSVCVQMVPEHRPTAGALLNHAFFKQVTARRAEASILPSLLDPVLPLSNFKPAEGVLDEEMTNLMSSVCLEDIQWDF